MMLVVFLVFVLCIALGLPLVYAMGLAGFLGSAHLSPTILAQQLFLGLNNFAYVAIPLFIIMGNLMTECGLTLRLVNFANALFGHFRGGLAIVCMAAGAFFAAISGSSVASTASLGSILIPSMKNEGYDAGFAGAVVAAAGSLGPIIPPSILLVIYASQVGVSVGAMFAAGIAPGVLSSLLYIIVASRIARKRNYPPHPKATLGEVKTSIIAALPALIVPALILAGVCFGVFTVTESAGIASIYALLFCLIVRVRGRVIGQVALSAFRETAAITFVIGASSVIAWVITRAQVPQSLVNFVVAQNLPWILVFLFINVLLIVFGMFLAPAAALVLATPLLLPLAKAYGMGSIQFGMLMVYNLNLGILTPPVAISLFMNAKMSGTTFEVQVREALPFLVISFIVLILLNVFPWMSTGLVNLMR
ncbi:MAG: TRAP transporter large permease [Methylobacteriaceae bacterium]|jgi:tripartite ATP-independent transporter DctM subunit|nr:TRAP transporter large permease [Methylobacteriaceae bacterium]